MKALPAKYRAPLSWFKWNRSFLAALRTLGARLNFIVRVIGGRGGTGAQNRDALGFAGFTTFGFVLELLIVKEKLLPGCENEVGAAIDTVQNLVLKFHGNAPFGPGPQRACRVELPACLRRFISTPLCMTPGFGPPCAGRHMGNAATARDK